MSDLRYRTVQELKAERERLTKYIGELSSKLAGQKVRLEWVDKYIFEKTPVEMTIQQIEEKLGHAVILK